MEMAAGIPFLEEFYTRGPQKVLYLQNELTNSKLQERFQRIYDGLGRPELKKSPEIINIKGMQINAPLGARMFGDFLERHQPDVTIIDALYYVVRGNVSDPAVCNQMIHILDKALLKIPDMTLIIAHHSKKYDPERPDVGMEEMLGGFDRWASSAIRLKRGEGRVRYMDYFLRYDEDSEHSIELHLDSRTDLFHIPGTKVAGAKREILEALALHTISSSELQTMFNGDYSKSTLFRAVKELERDGVVATDRQGKGAVYALSE